MNVIWFGNPQKSMYRGWWDMAILEDFFKDFTHFEGMGAYELAQTRGDGEKYPGAIVVIPARVWVGLEKELEESLSNLTWCLLIVAGDEEAGFDADAVNHPKMIKWIQYPMPGKHDSYKRFGCGYTSGIPQVNLQTKKLDWFFAGQVTHERRELMMNKLVKLSNGDLIETKGFAQGIDHIEYLTKLATAKVAPCPSGPATPDTFRLYEALELGCVPIADESTPKETLAGFWNWLFNEEVPFPTFTHYGFFTSLLTEAIDDYPTLNNKVQAWWNRKKYSWKQEMINDAYTLAGEKRIDDVTAIIPVSPIASHPETTILEETVRHIRFHFPQAKIIITFDGVRKEQEKLRAKYAEHIRRVLWKCREWGDIYPLIFEEHTHQVGMAREALKHVTTPLILYVEQDTPLVIDEPIDWPKLIGTIKRGDSNLVRFHFESHIPKEHSHLMIGEIEDDLQKTMQWSQRPHLARTDFYENILNMYFSAEACCFIEDKLHGVVQDDYNLYPDQAWDKWKMHIYCPNDTNIKRSYHTDGRGKDKKFDERQVW